MCNYRWSSNTLSQTNETILAIRNFPEKGLIVEKIQLFISCSRKYGCLHVCGIANNFNTFLFIQLSPPKRE